MTSLATHDYCFLYLELTIFYFLNQKIMNLMVERANYEAYDFELQKFAYFSRKTKKIIKNESSFYYY